MSCSSPSPCRLISIPPFHNYFAPLLSSPRFVSGPLPVRFYEYCRVSFKSKDIEAVGQARKAADTSLPHPEQLLNLRNRIISAKVAALFHSQEHGKQTEKWRREREAEAGNWKPFVSLMLTSVIVTIDSVMNFSVSEPSAPAQPNVLNLPFKAQRAVTAYKHKTTQLCFPHYLKENTPSVRLLVVSLLRKKDEGGAEEQSVFSVLLRRRSTVITTAFSLYWLMCLLDRIKPWGSKGSDIMAAFTRHHVDNQWRFQMKQMRTHKRVHHTRRYQPHTVFSLESWII